MKLYDKKQVLIHKETKQLTKNINILDLGEINRYNNKKKLHQENVAEHSFYVAETVIRICDMFVIPNRLSYIALKMAIAHDIPETITGDVSYDTKEVGGEDFKKMLRDMELDIIRKKYPHLYTDFLILECGEGLTSKLLRLIVKIADTVSVTQFNKKEMELGNKSKSTKEMYYNSLKRIDDMIEDLKEVIKEMESGGLFC